MYKDVQIIAEVKTESPFGYKSDKSWEELFAIAAEIGDMISIHTDPRWGGSLELLRKAKTLTDKPILAKGIHATDDEVEEALIAGADYVLVVGRTTFAHSEACLFEPLTLSELMSIPDDLRVVWNSRDLSDGSLKEETFEDARELFKGWMCQASNIKTVADIELSADAVIVGTHLIEFAESLKSS